MFKSVGLSSRLPCDRVHVQGRGCWVSEGSPGPGGQGGSERRRRGGAIYVFANHVLGG